MRKKGMMYEFIIRIVIALAILIPIAVFASSFFRLSNQGLDSYNQLVFLIKDVNSKAGDFAGEEMPLFMDQETAIVGFAKGDKAFEYQSTTYKSQIPSPNPNPINTEIKIDYIYQRPEKCGEKACVCLCRKVEIDSTDYSRVCQESICNTFEDVSFLPYAEFPVSSDEFAVYKNGGFLLTRHYLGERLSVAYVEKYNGMIHGCLTNPCITDAMKEPKYDVSESEITNNKYKKDDLINITGPISGEYAILGHKKNSVGQYYYIFDFTNSAGNKNPQQVKLIEDFDKLIQDIANRENYIVKVNGKQLMKNPN